MDKQILEILKQIQATQGEHTQLLRALEDRTKVTQAEVENLKYEVSETQGSIKNVQETVENIKESVDELTEKQDMLEDVTVNNWAELVKMKRGKKQA